MSKSKILTFITFVSAMCLNAQINYYFIDTTNNQQRELLFRSYDSEDYRGGTLVEFALLGDTLVFGRGMYEGRDSGLIYYRTYKYWILLEQTVKKISKNKKLFQYHNRHDYKYWFFEIKQRLRKGGVDYPLAKYPANGTDYLWEVDCQEGQDKGVIKIIIGDLTIRTFRFPEQTCKTKIKINYKIGKPLPSGDTIFINCYKIDKTQNIQFENWNYKFSSRSVD